LPPARGQLAEQQDKAAAGNMQKAIQGFAQTLNARAGLGRAGFRWTYPPAILRAPAAMAAD